MMKYLFFFILFIYNNLQAQERFLDVKINAVQYWAGDTMKIAAEYVDDFNNKIDGTLYIKIANDKGTVWNYRWPIYKGYSNPQIIIPAYITNGTYHIYFATRDEQFKVQGELLNNLKNDRLDATLINKENLVVTKDIPINYDNTFTYTNPYFRYDAILHFKNSKDKGRKPNIKIKAILDEDFAPTANKYIAVQLGKLTTPTGANTNPLPKRFDEVDAFFGKKIIKGELVTVKATNKSLAKNFEKENIGDAFKDLGEKTLNLFEDDPGLYGMSLSTYLQNNVLNISITRDATTQSLLYEVRGFPVVFYLDQVPIPIDFIENIDLNDIAIIKFYRAPFSLNTDANQCAIALFSKKNKTSANGRNSFTIKGYSSPIDTL